jgi:hypothetical protein
MAGIGDTLFNLFQPDPEQALGQWSDAQQAQNRGAIGLDVNGNPLPPPSAPSAGPQGAGGQGNGGDGAAVAAQASSTLQPQQEPNATKTPVSLGHLLMNLQQRNEASEGLNSSLGMGFAAFAQPRDREMVSRMFNVNQPDPTKFGATLMNLQGQQQGQDRMNALGQMVRGPQGAAIAQRLNISQDELVARYQADPQGVGNMIQSFAAPTDQMKNLEQINTYAPAIAGTPGANANDLQSLKNQITAGVAGPEASQMIADQINYRQTHNGQMPPWANNIQAYRQSVADKATLSKNIDDASQDVAKFSGTADTLRSKISDLQNNAGLKKILALPNTDPMKQAAWNAVNDTDPNWQKNAAYAVFANDPQVMQAISELKEINGQEYTSAISSLLGHGLRPSQTEVSAVREGFGQTKNLLNFNSMKDYKAQAIDPMLTRLDETEATAYGAANAFDAMPQRLRPFVHKTYLPGGKLNQEGTGSESWAGNVHKQLSPQQQTTLQKQIKNEPGNAFWYRDQLRRQGYDVED